MEYQTPNKDDSKSDEIDLGQLIGYIRKGLFNLFKLFLRFFVYIKRHMVRFGILLIAGLFVGFGLNQIVKKGLKTEVIVKPNLGSEAYLYDVVSEIEANINAQDSTFFNKLNINVDDLKGFGIEISPIKQEDPEAVSDDVEYLELLEKFRDEVGILDVVRTEILKNSTVNHRIIFYYKEGKSGRDIAVKLMKYINANDFYKELTALYTKNAEDRIIKNSDLVAQIDKIIAGYTTQMVQEEQLEGTLVLSDEERLNVPALLRLKNELIVDTEKKRLEIQGNVEVIRIISFGSTQEISKAFFGKTIIMIPTILIGLFLLIDLAKYLNRKAKEMNLE